MLLASLLSVVLVIEPGVYAPEPEAFKEECQSYYRPMVHTLLRAWPKSQHLSGQDRMQLLRDINEMLRKLDREKRLTVTCNYVERI